MKNKALITIFLIVFIDLLGVGIILPLLPFIGEKFGANPFEIGLIVSTYSFFQFIASPVLGRLSDRFGRKKVLIVSQIGSAIGYILLGVGHSLPIIFLSRIIDGTTGGNISIAQAYIADVTDKKNRARGMGMIGAAFGLGFIFGPAIGGLLSKISFAAPAYFAAFVALITVAATHFFLKETVDTKKSAVSPRTKLSFAQAKKVISIYPIGILILTFFLLNFAFSLMQGTFAIWTQDSFGFGPTQTGFLFTYIGILAVIIQLRILPFLIKRFAENKILKISLLFMATGLFLLPVLANKNFLYISLAFLALGNGLANPTLQALASEDVAPEEYGEVLGILQSGGSLGRIVGPAIGGEIYNLVGKDSPFLFGGTIILFTWLYLQKSLKHKT